MRTLIKNIGQIVGITDQQTRRKAGVEMSVTGTLDNAWLLIEDGLISGFGPMSDCPDGLHGDGSDSLHRDCPADSLGDLPCSCEVIDAEEGMVLPCFCDSHTHIVFAGSREREFLDKIEGLSYAQIAANGGGILNSADLLHRTSEDELYSQAMARVNEMIAAGTGAIEIKSGYGLSTEDELKILRVIRRIKESSPAIIKSTFLGAHAVGRAYAGRQEDYVKLVCEEMVPAVSAKGLADFIDVFCEENFFTPEQTDRILSAGEKYGMRAKLHANQLAVSGGVQVGVKHNALSVDHLESTTDDEIRSLADAPDTMPTMLPGASFFLRMQYGKALDFINSGLGLALASDYNPGSSPCGDMRFVMSLGCIQMRLTPIQSFNACTLNSAYAMGVEGEAGSITVGKKANVIITNKIPSLTWIPYCYRSPFINKVLLGGKVMVDNNKKLF